MPEVFTCFGWSLRPATFHGWFTQLNSIAMPDDVPLISCSRDIHLFTDGTCLNPALASCRIAAWAVVRAEAGYFSTCDIIASGPLPGVLQNAYRAETFALWRALVCARNCSGRICLWVDCQAVVVRFRKLLKGHPVRINSAHADLWLRIAKALGDFSPGQVSITKVTAHQKLADVSSPLEEWCFHFNHLVDRAAALAQGQRSNGFWEFYARHAQAVHACSDFSRRIQHVLLAVSQLVVRTEGLGDDHARPDLCVTPEVPHDAWNLCPRFVVPPGAVRWYGDEMVRTILSWFWFAVEGTHHQVRWISQFQLYVDFLMCGEQGPLHVDGWQQGRDRPHFDVLGIPFQKRARWFAKVLKECLKHSQVVCQYRFCRPFSEALLLHTSCLAVPWDPERISMVDAWFHQHCPGGVRRTSSALHSLPTALKDPRFPVVVLSMV